MKRLQIMIEEDLDADIERQARHERCSKAALIRRIMRAQIRPLPPIEEDPITQMIGADEGEPEDSVSINAVLYR